MAGHVLVLELVHVVVDASHCLWHVCIIGLIASVA